MIRKEISVRSLASAKEEQRTMAFNEDRQILNLTDSELEDLIKKWLAMVADTYVEFAPPAFPPFLLRRDLDPSRASL